MKDLLGDKLKQIEHSWRQRRITQYECIYIRIDGKNFSSWTKREGLNFADHGMIFNMQTAMNWTAKEFTADVAYCQSDEVSFGWFSKPITNEKNSQHIFDGRPEKFLSIIPSHFVGGFTIMSTPGTIPCFDARICAVDFGTLQEMFYWRFLDCKRNAIQGFCQQHYSHKKLQGVSLKEQIELRKKDDLWIDFESIEEGCRLGSFCTHKGPVEYAQCLEIFNEQRKVYQ